MDVKTRVAFEYRTELMDAYKEHCRQRAEVETLDGFTDWLYRTGHLNPSEGRMFLLQREFARQKSEGVGTSKALEIASTKYGIASQAYARKVVYTQSKRFKYRHPMLVG